MCSLPNREQWLGSTPRNTAYVQQSKSTIHNGNVFELFMIQGHGDNAMNLQRNQVYKSHLCPWKKKGRPVLLGDRLDVMVQKQSYERKVELILNTDKPHKKISKKKFCWCWDGSMNALADKVHKLGMQHSDMHFITQPHYSTTIPEPM